MEANDHTLQDLLTGEDQYLIPVFQRRYSWKEQHWKALWEDITELLDIPLGEDEHFVGAFVCMSGHNSPGERPQYLVIDGQQRLITISLILCAIRDMAESLDPTSIDDLSEKERDELANLADEIQEKHLVDRYRSGINKYRIISRTEDRDALFALFDQEEPDEEIKHSSVYKSYSYFFEQLKKTADKQGAYSVKKLQQILMQQLPLAMITASEDENPYTIFETLNERGLTLQESDLIRNFVFMQLDLDEQDQFNEDYWLPFENKFESTGEYGSESLTRFYRVYLMRDGEYVKKNGVYDAFRKRVDEFPSELAEIVNYYSDLYLSIKRPESANREWLQRCLERKQYLDIGTADPLVLNLLDQWELGMISDSEMKKIFRGLESFAIRRSICGESTRGYYQVFPASIKAIDENNVSESLFNYLYGRGWPEDEQFKSNFVTFDIYSREKDKCRLILETLQRSHGHKERVHLESLQIEHVMPQEIGDNEHGRAWKEMLSPDWESVHQEWLHTPGNLTLTGYNPELSNRKFEEKQELFEDSNVDLNDWFIDVDRWSKDEIESRGKDLAEMAAEIWPVPEEVRS